MPVGGGVPLPRPNSFYRSSVQLILRTGIRISLPAARRLSSSFHSPTSQQQPTFSLICTCQLSTSVIHSLLESLIQASYNLHSLNQLYLFILTTSSILTLLHLQHTKQQQNALLTRCCCPGWLCLRLIHPSSARESNQRWTGPGADFDSEPDYRCSRGGGDGAEHQGSYHHQLCP